MGEPDNDLRDSNYYRIKFALIGLVILLVLYAVYRWKTGLASFEMFKVGFSTDKVLHVALVTMFLIAIATL